MVLDSTYAADLAVFFFRAGPSLYGELNPKSAGIYKWVASGERSEVE
jgi:hypothetical protein